jgi:hypothetical protein
MKIAQVLILTLAAGLTARADFSYTSTRKSTAGQTASKAGDQTTKHYLKGQKMKIDSGGRATVIDFDEQTVTSIDNNGKTYTVTKFGDLGQTLKSGDVELKVDVKKTGETRNINGYNASEVVLTMDIDNPQGAAAGMKMQMEMHMWLSPDVPGAQELRAFHEKNRDRFPWAALGGGGNQSMQKAMVDLQRKMADMNGVAVLQVVKMKSGGNDAQAAQMQQGMAQARARLEEMQKQGGPQAAAAAQALARMGGTSSSTGALFETTTESGDFSTGSIPDSVFAIPAGYQKSDKK